MAKEGHDRDRHKFVPVRSATMKAIRLAKEE